MIATNDIFEGRPRTSLRSPSDVLSFGDSTPCFFLHLRTSGSSGYLMAIPCVHPSGPISSMPPMDQRLPPGDLKLLAEGTDIGRRTCCRVVLLKVLALRLSRSVTFCTHVSQGKFPHVQMLLITSRAASSLTRLQGLLSLR
jgi:hypothetical protein